MLPAAKAKRTTKKASSLQSKRIRRESGGAPSPEVTKNRDRIPYLRKDGQMTTDDTGKCEVLSEYFASVFQAANDTDIRDLGIIWTPDLKF